MCDQENVVVVQHPTGEDLGSRDASVGRQSVDEVVGVVVEAVYALVLCVESDVQDVIGLVASERPRVPVANIRVILNEGGDTLVAGAVSVIVCEVEPSNPATIEPPLPSIESNGNVDDVIA